MILILKSPKNISTWIQEMPGLSPSLWLGNVSTKFERQITSAIQCCYFAAETCVAFRTRPLLPTTKKDVLILPAHHHNNVIHKFLCHCHSWYIGCTSQRLQECIKQHISKSIRNNHSFHDSSKLSYACKTNSITQMENPSCISQYVDTKFFIHVRGFTFFHLFALEATLTKFFQPNLCQHKEFFTV